MSTTYECPSCHRTLAAPADVAGKDVKCPGCGTVFTAGPIDVAPADERFAITKQKPARPVSLPAAGENEEDFRSLFPRYDIPSWGDKQLPDSGVLPGRTRAAAAIACLAACALLAAVDIGASALHHQMLVRAENGEVVPDAEEETIAVLESVVGLATLALRLGTAVAFCLWFYRAYKNLPLLKARNLSFTPGWAVGSFFIPILQLFRPYQIAQEIWQASAPDISLESSWHRAKSWIIRFWWFFWIIGNLLASISMQFTLGATTPAQIQAALEFDMLSDIREILAAGFAIWMIVKIQQRQAMRLRRLDEEQNTEEEGKEY